MPKNNMFNMTGKSESIKIETPLQFKEIPGTWISNMNESRSTEQSNASDSSKNQLAF